MKARKQYVQNCSTMKRYEMFIELEEIQWIAWFMKSLMKAKPRKRGETWGKVIHMITN